MCVCVLLSTNEGTKVKSELFFLQVSDISLNEDRTDVN